MNAAQENVGSGTSGESRECSPALAVLRGMPSQAPFLEALGPDVIERIEPRLRWFGVPAGVTLFRKGDAASEVYVVVSGKLGVFVDSELGSEPAAQISAGELVGDMSVISGEPRSATVVATRDCHIITLPIEAIRDSMRSNTQLCFFFMQLLSTRLRTTTSHQRPVERVESIGVVLLNALRTFGGVGERLVATISGLGQRVTIIGHEQREREPELLRAAEPAGNIVVYLADGTETGWTRHCIRQSDRVIFVADAELPVAESTRAEIEYAEGLYRAADLVLVQKPERALPGGGSAWLDKFSSEHILHLRSGHPGDFSRVVRLLLRRGIGVVFSGGGARGFAHIGVLRAFAEAGVPIDMVGGTSIGAVVAGMVALDFSPDAIAQKLHQGFVTKNPINDYTFPRVALTRGRKMTDLIRYYYGEAEIENMWKTFFCVSTNLSTGKAYLHRSGPLWRALRASASIPGIVPPLILDGQVLVDGGIMNNFPTNIMGALRRGQVVGIEVSTDTSLKGGAAENDANPLRQLVRPVEAPSILRTLMCSGTISGEAQTIASRAATDVLIRPQLGDIDMLAFKDFDRAVELGYSAGKEAVKQFDQGLFKVSRTEAS